MKRRLFQGLVAFMGASRPPMPCWNRKAPFSLESHSFNKQSAFNVFLDSGSVQCWVFVFQQGSGIHYYTGIHTQKHTGTSPDVTPHSRQMGDSCSLEIFLHYCHQGTSLNVCFQAPVLMRTCLLKRWSTWQRTPIPTPTNMLCCRAGRVCTISDQSQVQPGILCCAEYSSVFTLCRLRLKLIL